MDRTDIEILAVLRHMIPMDLNGIKMSGTNMPTVFDLENRLFQLEDQKFIQKIDEKLYRITHNGRNLFWKENDEKNNLMRLLKASSLTDNEIMKITGLNKETFDDLIRSMMMPTLVMPIKRTDQGLLFELTPKGHQRIKLVSEEPTHLTQNFITNIDNVQINNSITIIQTNIDNLIIQVESDKNLNPDEKNKHNF